VGHEDGMQSSTDVVKINQIVGFKRVTILLFLVALFHFCFRRLLK
jgi:hypothetical protein